jgi:hypothetical protein
LPGVISPPIAGPLLSREQNSMKYDRVTSVLYRVFAVASLVLIDLAVLEALANAFSYSIVGRAYRPGRLVEFAAMLAVMAIPLLLRQIRQELRRKV